MEGGHIGVVPCGGVGSPSWAALRNIV
jgi:hypothetical protein